MDAKRGEIATVGTPLASVISYAAYEIEAFVPEADIAKIRSGSGASVTLDAYGGDVVFDAVVVTIDPAETVLDGVATYKTSLQFAVADPRVKSGMTANTDIEGERRDNVLFIPARAVSEKDSVKIVRILEGEDVREAVVETGIRGSNGDIEILSGLNEGDTILLK